MMLIIVFIIFTGKINHMFSKTCEYAIKTMVFIKTMEPKGIHIGLKLIAQTIDSPQAFTAKILQRLVRADLLQSIRGPHGGFKINDKNGPIYLKDIVVAIDGDAYSPNAYWVLTSVLRKNLALYTINSAKSEKS